MTDLKRLTLVELHDLHTGAFAIREEFERRDRMLKELFASWDQATAAYNRDYAEIEAGVREYRQRIFGIIDILVSVRDALNGGNERKAKTLINEAVTHYTPNDEKATFTYTEYRRYYGPRCDTPDCKNIGTGLVGAKWLCPDCQRSVAEPRASASAADAATEGGSINGLVQRNGHFR